MAMTMNPTFGGRAIFGWAPEVTPGTAVAAANYAYFDPAKSVPDYDPQRKNLAMATGTPFTIVNSYDGAAIGKYSVSLALWPVIGADLLAACGLGATLGVPGYITGSFCYLDGAGGFVGWQLPGSRCEKMTITGKTSEYVMVQADFQFMKKPVPLGGVLSAPALAADRPFQWQDLGGVTIPGYTNFKRMDDLSLEILFNLMALRGNSGSALPTDLIPTSIDVSGKYKTYLISDAAYLLFLAACQVPGSIVLPFSATCGSTTHTAQFTASNVTQRAYKLSSPLNDIVSAEVSWTAETPAGANPLAYATT